VCEAAEPEGSDVEMADASAVDEFNDEVRWAASRARRDGVTA
tara:strand:- start:11 stop:136 length:126 start_codon:yes stop_codon:yes gene_type:complete